MTSSAMFDQRFPLVPVGSLHQVDARPLTRDDSRAAEPVKPSGSREAQGMWEVGSLTPEVGYIILMFLEDGHGRSS